MEMIGFWNWILCFAWPWHWNWILCFAWPWHKLRIIENLSENCQRIQCRRCGRQYAINHDVRVVLPWDAGFEQFYAERRARSASGQKE